MTKSKRKSEKKLASFWTTLPGILTAVAGLITAVGSCLAVMISNPRLLDIFLPIAPTILVPANNDNKAATSIPPPNIIATQISPKDGMVVIYIPAGEFTMGSNNDESDSVPAHTVYLDSFWIDQTEVTNGMYSLCVEASSCNPPAKEAYLHDTGYKNHPVVYVSYEDAKTYCTWADRYLPSEAEWEKSGRGNDQRIYPWGNDFVCEKGNFDDEKLIDSDLVLGGENCDGYDRTSPIGSFKSGASPYGVLDMAGNVWEWVADWYNPDYYALSPITNPLGPSSGDFRIIRGGSWANIESGEKVINRSKIPSDTRNDAIGFRCASK